MTREQVQQALLSLGVDIQALGLTVDQVLSGATVELEHTQDPVVAVQIALDHLQERADYYERLEVVETNGRHPLYQLGIKHGYELARAQRVGTEVMDPATHRKRGFLAAGTAVVGLASVAGFLALQTQNKELRRVYATMAVGGLILGTLARSLAVYRGAPTPTLGLR